MDVCSLIICLLFAIQAVSVESNHVGNHSDKIFSINVIRKLPPGEGGIYFVTKNRKKRIVGGVASKIGAWPWIGNLGHSATTHESDYFWFGSCTLISDRYALTAAHCTKELERNPNAIKSVRLGSIDLDNYHEASKKIVRITNFYSHPMYGFIRNSKQNDIGLLELERDMVKFNDYIKPVSLPTPFRNTNVNNVKMYVAGWGCTTNGGIPSNYLQEIYLPVVDNSECGRQYNTQECSPICDDMMCAGSKGKSPCHGDSGGPLIWETNNNNYIMGIVSYGVKCGDTDIPGVFTRVTSYIGWINDTMQILESGSQGSQQLVDMGARMEPVQSQYAEFLAKVEQARLQMQGSNSQLLSSLGPTIQTRFLNPNDPQDISEEFMVDNMKVKISKHTTNNFS